MDQTIDTIIDQLHTQDKEAYAKRFASFIDFLKKESSLDESEEEKLAILKKSDQLNKKLFEKPICTLDNKPFRSIYLQKKWEKNF